MMKPIHLFLFDDGGLSSCLNPSPGVLAAAAA
jgi:hypothetical protein